MHICRRYKLAIPHNLIIGCAAICMESGTMSASPTTIVDTWKCTINIELQLYVSFFIFVDSTILNAKAKVKALVERLLTYIYVYIKYVIYHIYIVSIYQTPDL